MLKIAAFALLASIALPADAQSPKPAEIWYGASHIELKAADPAGEFAAQWQFDRANNGDIRIIKDERRGAARVAGTVLSVCEDRALLLKDIVPPRLHELQEMNEPVLYLQLALRLLGRAMPQGLPPAASQTAIDIADEKNTLRVRKAYRARKDFGAPWRARGVANRSAAGEVRFDMVLTYTPENKADKPSELKLSGIWAQSTRMPAIDNAFDVRGWRVHRVDAVAEVVAGNTYIEFEAKTAPLKFTNLGEVRNTIERLWVADGKAPRRSECAL